MYNQIAVEDAQTVPGAVPILALDMYEHAYHLEFGANATAYVDAFMRLIEWNVVTERFMRATADRQPRGPQASDDAPPSISVEELGALMATDQRPQVVDARPRNYVSRNPDTMRPLIAGDAAVEVLAIVTKAEAARAWFTRPSRSS